MLTATQRRKNSNSKRIERLLSKRLNGKQSIQSLLILSGTERGRSWKTTLKETWMMTNLQMTMDARTHRYIFLKAMRRKSLLFDATAQRKARHHECEFPLVSRLLSFHYHDI